MRSTNDNPADPLGSLGAPIRQAQPAPAPTPTGTPGVYRGADGKAFTATPPPPAPVFTVPVLPVYGMPVVHIDDETCDMREPVTAELIDPLTLAQLGCIQELDMSQADDLHKIMRSRWITPLDALSLAGCLSLSQRCGELRKRGVNVVSRWVSVGSKRVKAYTIAKGKGR